MRGPHHHRAELPLHGCCPLARKEEASGGDSMRPQVKADLPRGLRAQHSKAKGPRVHHPWAAADVPGRQQEPLLCLTVPSWPMWALPLWRPSVPHSVADPHTSLLRKTLPDTSQRCSTSSLGTPQLTQGDTQSWGPACFTCRWVIAVC